MTNAEELIDEIYQELEDWMDPEYTRVQLVRKIKAMLNLIDEHMEEKAQLSEFSEPEAPRK